MLVSYIICQCQRELLTQHHWWLSLGVLINEINKAYWIRRHFSVYEITRITILWPTSGQQKGYLRPLVTTVHCGWRPQHSWSHREAILGQRISQFIVVKGYNIWKVTVAKIVDTPIDFTEGSGSSCCSCCPPREGF